MPHEHTAGDIGAVEALGQLLAQLIRAKLTIGMGRLDPGDGQLAYRLREAGANLEALARARLPEQLEVPGQSRGGSVVHINKSITP